MLLLVQLQHYKKSSSFSCRSQADKGVNFATKPYQISEMKRNPNHSPVPLRSPKKKNLKKTKKSFIWHWIKNCLMCHLLPVLFNHKMMKKVAQKLNLGTPKLLTFWPLWAMLWAWATSGGFPILPRRTVEELFSFHTLSCYSLKDCLSFYLN